MGPSTPEESDRKQHQVLRAEFDRAAAAFAERTRNRFDNMDVVEFSRVRKGASVLEVGAGTGNFLRHFGGIAALMVGADITLGMLSEGRRRNPSIVPVAADGARLPLASRSFDLVITAQALHHVSDPIPFLREMRRVAQEDGAVLIVDQVATERYEEIAVRHELEVLRDPSHAATRPPSAFSIMARAAGLEVVDEQIFTGENRLSQWMWPGEFPTDRIDAVRDFIERFGAETGMEWHREGDDWVFTRRRIMLLAERVG